MSKFQCAARFDHRVIPIFGGVDGHIILIDYEASHEEAAREKVRARIKREWPRAFNIMIIAHQE